MFSHPALRLSILFVFCAGVSMSAAEPALTTVAPDTGTSASDYNTSATTLTVSGSADTGATVELLAGAVDPPTLVVATGTAVGGVWTVNWVSGVTAPAFRYLRVRATTGGTAASSRAVFIDPASDAPVVTGVTPGSGGFTNSSVPTIAGTANPGAAIEVFADGNLIGTATANASGVWSCVPSSPLTTGLQNLIATQTDLAGNPESAPSAPFAITVDALTSEIVLYSAATGLSRDATPDYSGKAEPGATVELRTGSVGGAILATTTAPSDGRWSLAPGTVLADGAYALFVVARDLAGNQKSTPAQAVTVDTTVVGTPVITGFVTNSGTVPSGSTTNDRTVSLTGTLTGAESGASVVVSVNGIDVGTASGSPWTIALPELNDATYTVTASISDPAGNTRSVAPATITISNPSETAADRFTPQFNGEIGGGLNLVTDDSTPTIGGLARPNASITVTPTVVVAGATPGISTITANAQGGFSYTPSSPLADGTYSFAFSNSDGSSPSFTVVIDTVDPSGPTNLALATDTGVSGSDRLTNDSTLIFTASGITDAAPSSGGLVASLRLDGVVVATVSVAAGSAVFDLTGRVLPDGGYAATVTVSDAAANTPTPFGPQTVTIDRFTDPPLLGGVSPDTGLRSTDRITRSSAGTTIRGRAEPGASVAITLTGSSTINLTAVADGSGQFTAVAGAIVEGSWTVSAVATDPAGNTNLVDTHPDTPDPRQASMISLLVDNIPPPAPTAQISEDRGASSSDNLTSDDRLMVSGTTVANGQVVVTFVQGGTTHTRTVIADGSGAYVADFTNVDLADGAWMMTAIATDVAGNTGSGNVQTVTIDTVPPALAVIALVDDTTGTLTSLTVGSTNDRVTNDSDVLISGTVEAGATVSLAGSSVIGAATVVGTNWSRQSGVQPAGAQTFTATATDAAGNNATATVNATIDLAMTNPSISAVTPSRGFVGGAGGGIFTTNTDTPSVTVASEAGAAVRLEVSPAGLGSWTALSAKAATGGTATWSGAELALVAPDGAVTNFDLRVAGVDIAGNASPGFGTASLVVDRVVPGSAPTVTNVADDTVPANISPWDTAPYTTDRYTNDNRLIVSGTGALVGSESYVRVYVNGVPRGYVATPAGGAWSVNLGAAPFNVVVPNGALSITARNGDLAGNEGPTSAAYALTVDTVRPTVVITGLVNADSGRSNIDRITQTAQPLFAGTVGDGTGTDDGSVPVVRAVLKRGATLVETLTFASTEAGAADAWTYTVPAAQPDGVYTLDVTCFDLAGNSAVGSTVGFTVDRVANAIIGLSLTTATDTGESNSDRLTKLARPALTGAAVETQAIVRVYRNSSAGALIGTATAAANGSWTLTLIADLAEGANTLAVTQEDIAGNVSPDATVVVTLDTIAPAAATITDLTAGTDSGTVGDRRTNAATPALAGTCPSDADRVLVTATRVDGTTVTVVVDLTLGATAWQAVFTGLGEGEWSVTSVSVDAAGNQAAASAPYALIVDRSPPNVAIAGLTTATDTGTLGDLRTSQRRPVLTGSAGIDAVSVTLTISGVGTVVVPVVSGVWSWTPTADLVDDLYTITATATDVAGNASGATPIATLVIDGTPPATPAVTAIAGDTGTPGDFLTRDNTLIISGTAEAGTQVTIFLDGAPVGLATAGGGGTWSFDLTARALADGDYTLTCRATDGAGNASAVSAPRNATIDTATFVPALIRLDTDTSNPNDRLTSDTTPTVSGSAEPGATITITANGPGGPFVVIAVAAADGSWTSPPFPVLADGSWNITATAVDPAGNAAGPSSAWPFAIDSSPPAAPVIVAIGEDTGTAGDFITADQTLTVSGTAEAGASVTLTRDGVVVAVVVASSTGAWTADLTGVTLKKADYSFVATATDPAGNTGPASAVRPVTIDTVPDPIPLITGVTDDTGNSGSDALTSDTSPTITGKGVPGSTINVLDGVTLLGTAIVQSDGTWSLAVAGPLANGAHPLTAISIDNVGNRSNPSLALNLVIDTTAPSAIVISIGADTGVGGDGITADATWVIGGTSEPGATIVVRIDDLEVGRTAALSNGIWSFDASAVVLADGLHAVSASAIDAAGNAGADSAPLSMTVDTVVGPPLVVSFADDSGVTGDQITNDRTPTLQGQAEPGATVTVKLAGVTVGTPVADGSGAWTLAIPGPLPDATYTFVATQVDVAGNGPSPSTSYAITVDGSISTPTILGIDSDTGVAASDGITSDTTPTIRGTADPGVTVVIRINEAIIGTVTAASDGTWSLPTNLGEGSFDAVAITTDPAGNTASTLSFPIRVDATAPAAPVITTWGSDTGTDGDGVTADNTLTVGGMAEPGSDVTIYVDDIAIATVRASSGSAPGSWSVTLPVLADGARNITARATDNPGNISPFSAATVVTIDTMTSLPVITGLGPDSGRSASDRITNASPVSVAGVAEPGATVTLRDGGSVLGTAVADSGGAWEVSFSPAEAGLSLAATVVDLAGNAAGPGAVLAVTVDRTVPLAPVVNLPPSPTADNTPTISGTSEANAFVQILVGGVAIAQVTADGAGAWTWTPTVAWADATIVISARAIDIAGNLGPASAGQSLVVDTAAPGAATISGISPDTGTAGDGVTSETRPTVSGTAEPGALVEIRIAGQPVGSVVAGSDGSWSLALPADGSDALPDGTYLLTAVAIDAAGNVGDVSPLFTLVVDTIPPSTPAITGITPSTSAPTSPITGDSTPSISGTAEIGATVTVSVDGVIIGTVVADESGDWTLPVTVPLAEGVHRITATSTDPAGNASAPSGDIILTVDLSTPTPAVTGLAPDIGTVGDGITSAVRPTLAGTAEPGASVTVTIRDAGGAVIATLVATADSSGLWSVTPIADLSDGAYTATPVATDTFGNQASGTAFAFTVDAVVVPPVITAVTATGGPVADGGLTNDATPVVSGTATGAMAVEVSLDGVVLRRVDVTSGLWSLDLGAIARPLSDGQHAFTVVAIAASGALSPASATRSLIVDTTTVAPGLTGTLPSDGLNSGGVPLTSNNQPTLVGTAEQGSSVSVSIDGGASVIVIADSNGRWTLAVAAPLADGNHTVALISTDPAGNSASGSGAFAIDTTMPGAPVITDLGPDSGSSSTDRITAVQAVTVSGTAEAGATVVIRVGGSEVARVVANGAGAWSVPAPGFTVAEGSLTVTAEAIDAVGNVSSPGSISATIDRTAPTAPIVIAPSGPIIAGAESLSGTAEPGAVVGLFVDGVLVATVTAASDGRWTASTAALTTGTRQITATATDVAGNTSAQSNALAIVVRSSDRRVEVKPAPCGVGSNLPLVGIIVLLLSSMRLRRGACGAMLVTLAVILPMTGQTAEGEVADNDGWYRGGWELLVGTAPQPDDAARYVSSPFAAPSATDWNTSPRLGVRGWAWRPDATGRHGPWAACEVGWYRLDGDETASRASDPSLHFRLHVVPVDLHLGWRWQAKPWLVVQGGAFASAGPLLGRVTASDSVDGSLQGGSGLGAGWLWGWGAVIGVRAQRGHWEAGLEGRWSDSRVNLAFERREVVAGTEIARDNVELRQDLSGLGWAIVVGYRY